MNEDRMLYGRVPGQRTISLPPEPDEVPELEVVPTLTVAEVIAELQKLPQDSRVIAEGCDCYNDVVRVDYDPKDHKTYMKIEGWA